MLDLIPIAAVWASMVLNYSWCGVRLDHRRRKVGIRACLIVPSPNPDVTIRTIGRRCVTNAKHLRLETKSNKSLKGLDVPHWMQYPGPTKTKHIFIFIMVICLGLPLHKYDLLYFQRVLHILCHSKIVFLGDLLCNHQDSIIHLLYMVCLQNLTFCTNYALH